MWAYRRQDERAILRPYGYAVCRRIDEREGLLWDAVVVDEGGDKMATIRTSVSLDEARLCSAEHNRGSVPGWIMWPVVPSAAETQPGRLQPAT